MTSPIGFGSKTSTIYLYLANRPPIDDYPALDHLRSLAPGEIAHIVKHTSNHWRKVFNVYAKLAWTWQIIQGKKNLQRTWQDFRDLTLFQNQSEFALIFSHPTLVCANKAQLHNRSVLHIIAGKTYATQLGLPELTWLDSRFAVNRPFRVVVSPYPDYRQLSNVRIERLLDIMKSLL